MWNTFVFVSSVEKCMYEIFPLKLCVFDGLFPPSRSLYTQIRKINQIAVSKEQIAVVFTEYKATREILQHLEF